MDDSEKQVACVYLMSLWIDMRRSESFMNKQFIYKIEETIAGHLEISLRETKLMLDRKFFAQEQKENFYASNQPTASNEPTEQQIQDKEKIKKEIENIKSSLGIINEMVCKINRVICDIENVN